MVDDAMHDTIHDEVGLLVIRAADSTDIFMSRSI